MASTRWWTAVLVLAAAPLSAQSVDDGMLLPKRALDVGLMYSHESWSNYWEGELKRNNENIGTLTTRSVAWMAAYGLTDRITVVGTLPYIWTRASQGTSRGLSGIQDLMVGVKFRLLSTPFTDQGTLRALVVGSASGPASDYTPDYLPLSIGVASSRFAGRLTLNFQAHAGWFINGSGGYTWRSNIHLDRPAYYTDGQLFLTDEVDMPNVFDYTVSTGWRNGRLFIPVSLTRQKTLGGGDIRRQDAPFASNRMDFVRLDGSVMYALNRPENLALRAGVSRILSGRNVGEATAITGGVFYRFHF